MVFGYICLHHDQIMSAFCLTLWYISFHIASFNFVTRSNIEQTRYEANSERMLNAESPALFIIYCEAITFPSAESSLCSSPWNRDLSRKMNSD